MTGYFINVRGGSSDMKLKAKIFYKTKTEKLKRDIYKQYNPVFGLFGWLCWFLFDWFGFLRLGFGFGFILVFVFEYLCLWLGSCCVYSNKCQWGLHFGFGVCMGFVIVVKERQTERRGVHSITNCDARRSLEIVKEMKQNLCYVLKISVLVSVVQLVFKDRQQRYYYFI